MAAACPSQVWLCLLVVALACSSLQTDKGERIKTLSSASFFFFLNKESKSVHTLTFFIIIK